MKFIVRITFGSVIICAAMLGAASGVPTTLSQDISLPRLSQISAELRAGAQMKTIPEALVKLLPKEDNSMFHFCNRGPGTAITAKSCVYGDKSTSRTLVVLGDSHAIQWIPALDVLGKKYKFKVVVFARVGCQFANIALLDFRGALDTGCATFRTKAISKINHMAPAPSLILFVELEQYKLKTPSGHTVGAKEFAQAEGKTIAAVHVHASQKVVMLGDPFPSTNPSVCLSIHLLKASACNTSPPGSKYGVGGKFNAYRYLADARAAIANGAQVMWTEHLFCNSTCPDISANILVHADWEHISAKFATHVSYAFGELVGCTEFGARAATLKNESISAQLNGGNKSKARIADCLAQQLK